MSNINLLTTPNDFKYIVTHSTEETEMVGQCLATLLETDESLPRVISFFGDLGVGKTAFTRGVAQILAPGVIVRSPTFALVNEYRANGKKPLYHFDMYRIETEEDLESIGFDDYLTKDAFFLIEWSEKIPFALPENRLEITISKTPENINARLIQMQPIYKNRSV